MNLPRQKICIPVAALRLLAGDWTATGLPATIEGAIRSGRAAAKAARRHRRVFALHDGVGERPRIAAYLASPRRIPFNEEGIFRHYPELDAR